MRGLVEAGVFYLVVGGIFFLAYEVLVRFALFSAWIVRDIALEILKSLLQVDGILIGFTGLVCVHMFTTIQSYFGALREASSLSATSAEGVRLHMDRHRKLSGRRSSGAQATVGTILAFLLSILFGVGAMSYAPPDTTIPGAYVHVSSMTLYWTLSWMFTGVAGIFWLIYLSTRS